MSVWGAEDAERHERLRNEVMRELVETEVAYVEHLKTIVQVFVNPVKAQGLLNTAEVSNIFSNITLILTINTELMNDLLKIKKSKPSTQNIGEIFLKLADYLKMYTQYCSNQGRALAEIENLKKTNPQFSTFLEAQPPRSPPTLSPFPKLIADPLDLAVECKKNERCHRQDIGSFIIKPIQRICKYPLLLREIVQHTPKDHFDYENLLAAVAKMTEVVTDVNENKRKVENVQKLLEIQNAIVSDTGVVGTLKLVEPGRKFVQEGMLVDLRAGKEMERKYFLFNNILILARPMLKGKNQAGVVYKLKDEIALKQTFIRDNESAIANAFDLVNFETTKFYTLAMPTLEDKRCLMQKLSEITNEYTDKAKTDSTPDQRGGYSISLSGTAIRGKQDLQSQTAGYGSGSVVFGQRKESEILILEKKERELEKEHKKIRADFEAVLKSNAIVLKKKDRIRQQLGALNEEKEKFLQREFDERVLMWDEAMRKRDFINSEQRRKIIDLKRRKDELKDDTKDLNHVAQEVRRIKEAREKGDGGVERTEIDVSTEEQVSSYDWKRPYPRQLYKAFDLITALAKDLNLELEMPEIVLVGLRGQGKSTLLEAFLGHQFTDVGYGATRRPLSLQIKNQAERHEPKVLLSYISRNGVEKTQAVSLSHFPEVMKKKNQGAYSASSSTSSLSSLSSTSTSAASSSASTPSSSMSTIVMSTRSKDRKDGTLKRGQAERHRDEKTGRRDSKPPAFDKLAEAVGDGAAAAEKKADGATTPKSSAAAAAGEPDADKQIKREGSRKMENISFSIDVPVDKLDSVPSPASSTGGKLTSPRSFPRSVSSPRLNANAVTKDGAVPVRRDNGDMPAVEVTTAPAVVAPLTMAATSSPRAVPGANMPAFSAQALADLGRPVHATYEYQSTFDMTLIDAPGLAFRSGTKAEMSETENAVRKLIAPSNRIILVVEEFIDAQSESASYARNYLLDLVKEYDPTFSRTVFAYSKFYHLMKNFTSPEEVNKQLSLRPHNSFYISLFNDAVRSKLTNKEDFQKKVINCYYRDLMILEKLGYDKSLKKRLGVNRLRRYLLELTWKKHKELIPQIPALIDTLSQKTADRRVNIQRQLEAAVQELETDRAGRITKLRFIAGKYSNEFLATIFYSLESNFSAVFNITGALSDYDLFDKSRGMVGLADTALLTKDRRWRTPFWDNCLGSGGAQLRKLLTEFRGFVENLEFHLNLLELQAIPLSDRLSPHEFMTKAAEVAETKFREAFAPFVDKLFRRTLKIFQRLCAIVDTTLKRKSTTTGRPASSPFASSLNAYRFSAYTTSASSSSPSSSSPSSSSSPTMNRGSSTNNGQGGDGGAFKGVNEMYNDLLLGRKLKYSSPQLAFCVRDHFYSHVKKVVALAQEKCLEELRCRRLVYFPTLLTDERIRTYATPLPSLTTSSRLRGSFLIPRGDDEPKRKGSLIARRPSEFTGGQDGHLHPSGSPLALELRKRSVGGDLSDKTTTPPPTPNNNARGGAAGTSSPGSPRVSARDEPGPPSGGQLGVTVPSPGSGSGSGVGSTSGGPGPDRGLGLLGMRNSSIGSLTTASSAPSTPKGPPRNTLLSDSMERLLTSSPPGSTHHAGGGGGSSRSLLSSWQDTEDKLKKDFVPLASRYFNDIRDRVARNTLLKFQEFCLVPLLYEKSVLTSAMQRKLAELNDEAIEKLFDVGLYLDQLKSELAKLDEVLKVCEERRALFQSLQPDFCHPAMTSSTTSEPTKN
ncbi:RhoGEF domain containing protein [Acanthamoeba castellanii str. Neff]|uniref:RhoGEF domain containing protein n=1 Tax=Acanthamoeba castellanii (strain ATCC 30010 / Neff) TaxID=1257118 RepID=L8GDW8_ACACF|nr:RhoGEF domain containing protein [Acanthamoeba castellanii str. Neff]ELR11300.1 RhoGEF domain containing protein [Acanthamoeba castellanii str. Neff]